MEDTGSHTHSLAYLDSITVSDGRKATYNAFDTSDLPVNSHVQPMMVNRTGRPAGSRMLLHINAKNVYPVAVPMRQSSQRFDQTYLCTDADETLVWIFGHELDHQLVFTGQLCFHTYGRPEAEAEEIAADAFACNFVERFRAYKLVSSKSSPETYPVGNVSRPRRVAKTESLKPWRANTDRRKQFKALIMRTAFNTAAPVSQILTLLIIESDDERLVGTLQQATARKRWPFAATRRGVIIQFTALVEDKTHRDESYESEAVEGQRKRDLLPVCSETEPSAVATPLTERLRLTQFLDVAVVDVDPQKLERFVIGLAAKLNPDQQIASS